MERFTRRDEFGNADIIGVDSEKLQSNLDFGEFNKVTNALNKLAGYEDLEEKGKLFKGLPCSIGDTVYELVMCDDGEYRIFPMVVKNFNPYGALREVKNNEFDQYMVWNIYLESKFTYTYKHFSDFGKSVFCTMQEAEEALHLTELRST